MLYAQILAGGKGTRMGNVGMPKQFLQLGNRPIIIHTLEKFVLNDEFDAIIVSCPENWIQHAKDIISKYIKDDRVKIIAGGKERNDTLKNGITYIHEQFGSHMMQFDLLFQDESLKTILNYLSNTMPLILSFRLQIQLFEGLIKKSLRFLLEMKCIKGKPLKRSILMFFLIV
jgi:NDP-sugar pyrophosphorylase family protein